MKKQQHYKAALYCRLSVDDGNFGGSVSIEMVLSISLDTFYSNKNYAARKI